MLTGYPPFAADTRDELFDKIRKGAVKYPSSFSTQIKDLLGHLFEKDPEKRWGEGREGATSIKQHAWFRDMRWDLLISKQVKVPFVPKLKNDLDLSNFDPVKTRTVDIYDLGVHRHDC